MQATDFSLEAGGFESALKKLAEEARDDLHMPFVGISFFPGTAGFLDEATLRDIVVLPSEQAACIATVASGGVFSVTEMHIHAQFTDNHFVRNVPFIRSYLGCAVRNRTNRPIGTFCAFDTENRHFSDGDARSIQSFAGRAAAYVELLTLTRTLAELSANARLLAAIDLSAELGYEEPAKHMISLLYAALDARDSALR